MDIIEALDSIEAAAQGNARLEALRRADSPELRKLLTYALDPAITFGIKKLPPPSPPGYCFRNSRDWNTHLVNLLEELRYRRATGHVAQEAVALILGTCANESQIKWAERLLRQDLRINLGAKDVNNVFGKNTIYLFEVPLATDYAKVKDKDFAGRWEIQPKMDGGRCVAVLPGGGGRVQLLSRTGKEWPNFESIRAELQRGNNNRTGGTIYLDGEVVSYVNGRIDFQSIQKTMRRIDGVEIGDLKFIVFDAADEAEWKEPRLPYYERLRYIDPVLYGLGVDKLKIYKILSQTVVDPTREQLKAWSDGFVAEGYEGGMGRRSDIPVVNKRSKTLLKVKTFIDDEATIVGAIEGNGKATGMVGALKCLTKAGVAFEIGTGLDDKTRQEIWDNLAEMVGEQCSFKYQRLTDDNVPLLPVFRGIRHKDDIS